MRAILVLLGIVALVAIVLLSFGFISLDQTQSAQAPRIRVEGGQAPEFKVDVGKVDVTTTNRTVEVPQLQVEKAEGAPR
jgi:hypothetical protein